MGREGEMGVESNSQCAESPFQRQHGTVHVQGDVRISGRLFSLRSEKDDGGFWSLWLNNISLWLIT